MQDSVKLNFNGEEFEVKKIPVRRIGALAMTLNNLPEVFKDIFMNEEGEARDLDTTAMLEKAPMLIMSASETLPPFLSVASGIDLEKILDGGIDDFILLIQSVLAVNNFETIVGYLKNFMKNQK
ncbi:hypothetical protein [Bacillus sp. FJAT-50079]|uniref:hypothetical protein n=1 Tax=Bacillus sp. FJAT-50079 TaxID=2833577 RepID=UPI001BCA4E83|nr:hypothetical protein [Bacillus sp. FJAT-50079]MBS4207443.1 hypothetical protein [Bacillus sp. FJAT-50079]